VSSQAPIAKRREGVHVTRRSGGRVWGRRRSGEEGAKKNGATQKGVIGMETGSEPAGPCASTGITAWVPPLRANAAGAGRIPARRRWRFSDYLGAMGSHDRGRFAMACRLIRHKKRLRRRFE